MQIFDDLIQESYQERLKNVLLNDCFPWFFLPDLTGGYRNQTQMRPAFGHHFFLDGKSNSDYGSLLVPLITAVEKKVGLKFEQILKARTFLQLPLNIQNDEIDDFHVDLEEDHYVILYYVLSSDGETLLSNNVYETGSSVLMKNYNEIEIVKRVEPKQGRILFFEGKYFHTALQPKLHNRCIINIDLKVSR